MCLVVQDSLFQLNWTPPFGGRIFQHIARFYYGGVSYHRTVIVTAAVHSSLLQELIINESPPGLTYEHWARVGPYTSSYELSRDLCF
jgi:hypothetical protein